MSKTRRVFLTQSSLGLLGAAVGCRGNNQKPVEVSHAPSATPPPGEPSAFATAPAVGPEVSPTTFVEAEKLVQMQLSQADRAQAAA